MHLNVTYFVYMHAHTNTYISMIFRD